MKMIDEDEKKKIMATKPPSFTMKMLRPLAHVIAYYTDPSAVLSVAREFGFDEQIETRAGAAAVGGAAAVLLHMFETLRDERNDEDIKKIIESLLNLYAQLIDEKLHDKGLIGPVRKILHRRHFTLGFHVVKKEYELRPFEGPVHGSAMYAEGITERDFQDDEKRKMRMIIEEKIQFKNEILTKIVCVRSKNGGNKFLIIINDNYKKPIYGDKAKSSWDLFFKIAEGERVSYQAGHKQNIDYFNSNKQNRIYTQTELKKTQILKVIDDIICPNVPMEVISEKTFKTKQNKQLKTT